MNNSMFHVTVAKLRRLWHRIMGEETFRTPLKVREAKDLATLAFRAPTLAGCKTSAQVNLILMTSFTLCLRSYNCHSQDRMLQYKLKRLVAVNHLQGF